MNRTPQHESVPGAATPAARRWWFAARLCISLVLVAFLMHSVDWPKVWVHARTVSPVWLALSLFYIPASILFVAMRYRLLVDGMVPLGAMLRLVVFQGAVSTFLANAAGSLGFVGVLAKLHNVPVALAIQSAIVARAGDMLASLVVAAALVAVAWDRLATIRPLVVTALLLSVVTLLAAFATVLAARRLATTRFPGADAVENSPWRKAREAVGLVVRMESARALPGALFHSFLLQGVVAVAMYFNARAFGLEIGFFEAALVGVVASFVASVPVTVFGGLGIYEVSTVGLLAVFGVPIEAGAGMILVVRAIFFAVMAAALATTRAPGQ